MKLFPTWLVAVACALFLGCTADTTPGVPLSAVAPPGDVAAALRLDSLRAQMARDLADELAYYLDRHNVEDEGYELVAAYAARRLEGVAYTTDTIGSLGRLSVWNVGRWKDHQRQGMAIARDSLGRLTIGLWEADTLVRGIRIDSLGLYSGDMRLLNGQPAAHGHGTYVSADDRYFEGRWVDDRREGFGLQLLENDVATVLSTGLWEHDQFRGERMNYHSERIYGIDVSRYQHGKGRKKYPIQWSRLRIAHLGSKSQKQISGTVDYPVSFCYIKSTEGISIRNPYFQQDYAAARKAGVHIGAYHFFSTKTGGAAQAQHFLASTRMAKGDLPPVLDIEPSVADINRMGGSPALWRSVRAWLSAVEKHTGGVRPILYVNQKFVNRYLPDAPDIKRDYKIWIARYGEYKPDVRLAIWQLSPDGRVRGITGDVDINVFNGYRSQFDDFLEHETIR